MLGNCMLQRSASFPVPGQFMVCRVPSGRIKGKRSDNWREAFSNSAKYLWVYFLCYSYNFSVTFLSFQMNSKSLNLMKFSSNNLILDQWWGQGTEAKRKRQMRQLRLNEHLRERCWYRKSTCNKWSSAGHLARVCCSAVKDSEVVNLLLQETLRKTIQTWYKFQGSKIKVHNARFPRSDTQGAENSYVAQDSLKALKVLKICKVQKVPRVLKVEIFKVPCS